MQEVENAHLRTYKGLVNFTAPDSVAAMSLDPQAGDDYRGKPIWDLDSIDANLNRSGYDWYTNNYGELDDGTLNFGFWANYEELANSYYVNRTGSDALTEAFDEESFSPFTAQQQAATRTSVALWDDLISISFRETRSGVADLNYGNTDTGGAQAYAYLPFGDELDEFFDTEFDFEEVGRLSGDVWVDGFVASNFFPLADSYYSVATLIHETGHSLGLSHPGDYDALDDDDGDGEPDPITYENDAFFAQDSLQYSIMSYFDAYETGAQHIDWSLMNFAYAATPLVHDISAIQAIYGADMTTRTGDTVYGFNSTAGRSAYDFAVNTRPIVSIWDAGGTDTLDFSGWNTPSVIDLNEGAFSSGGGIEEFLTLEQVNANRVALGFAPRSEATAAFYEGLKAEFNITSPLFADNISIAYGAVIENAVGGGGDDLIIVNQVANAVTGGGGSDTVSYQTATAAVVASLATGLASGGGAGDSFASIENLIGSDFADSLTGNGGANRLDGGRGGDALSGGGGADRFAFDNAGSTGSDSVADFGRSDALVTTKAIRDGNNDGIITFGKNGVLALDTDGDQVKLTGGDPAKGLRYLGTQDGEFFYADARVRPVAAKGEKVFEGTVGSDTFAGTVTVRDVFFFDTSGAAGTGDDRIEKMSKLDIIVLTTKLSDSNNDGIIGFGNDGTLDLPGNGGSLAIFGNADPVTRIEFDGAVSRGGVDYFVYSLVGSSAGTADLHFG